MFEDFSLLNTVSTDDKICEACINGKEARLTFNPHLHTMFY